MEPNTARPQVVAVPLAALASGWGGAGLGSPGLAQRDGQGDAQKGVESVALLQAVRARQGGPAKHGRGASPARGRHPQSAHPGAAAPCHGYRTLGTASHRAQWPRHRAGFAQPPARARHGSPYPPAQPNDLFTLKPNKGDRSNWCCRSQGEIPGLGAVRSPTPTCGCGPERPPSPKGLQSPEWLLEALG